MIIDNEEFFTVTEFSKKVNTSAANVYYLIKKGNKIRKLKAENIFGMVLIPAEELIDFPFTTNKTIPDLEGGSCIKS